MVPPAPWPLQLGFSAFGASVVVQGSDPALAPRILKRLPFGSVAGPVARPDRVYSLTTDGTPAVYVDGRLERQAATLAPVLRFLRADLQRTIACCSPEFVFVHAGVVEWRGRAIVLPGVSRTGKSTLVSALLDAGARYLSDEYALIDDAGYVRAFARRLSLRAPGGVRMRTRIACDRNARLPVGAIVFSRFRAGATWQPRPTPIGETLIGLMANTVTARIDPARAARAARQAVRGAVAFTSDRGEAADTAPAILQHVDNWEVVV